MKTYLKDRALYKNCYYKKKRKNNNNITLSQNQQARIDNVNHNKHKRTLLVGPSFSGNTYLMLKILSRRSDRDIFINTRSPPEQYSNSKIKFNEIGEEIKLLNEYEKTIIVFDDILGTSNSKNIDQFFIRGRHNNLDNYYLSQSYFESPKLTIRNHSDKFILFTQTLKDKEKQYRDVGGYDLSYDKKTWEEKHNYLYIDRSKKRDIKEDNVFVMKAKTHILNVLLKEIHSSFCNLMSMQNILCFFFSDYKKNDIFNKKRQFKRLRRIGRPTIKSQTS